MFFAKSRCKIQSTESGPLSSSWPYQMDCSMKRKTSLGNLVCFLPSGLRKVAVCAGLGLFVMGGTPACLWYASVWSYPGSCSGTHEVLYSPSLGGTCFFCGTCWNTQCDSWLTNQYQDTIDFSGPGCAGSIETNTGWVYCGQISQAADGSCGS